MRMFPLWLLLVFSEMCFRQKWHIFTPLGLFFLPDFHTWCNTLNPRADRFETSEKQNWVKFNFIKIVEVRVHTHTHTHTHTGLTQAWISTEWIPIYKHYDVNLALETILIPEHPGAEESWTSKTCYWNMFILENKSAHNKSIKQHLQTSTLLHKCEACNMSEDCLQSVPLVLASVHLGIPTGTHPRTGMSTDIPLRVNVCSLELEGERRHLCACVLERK